MTEPNWMDTELKTLQSNVPTGEQLPSLKLEANKLTTMTVDYSKLWEKWSGTQGGKDITKYKVPVTVNGEHKIFWLNVKNPLARQLVERGKAGKVTTKVIMTGSAEKTVYNIVEE